MQNRPGTFIVIEGTDGSGKGTQFTLLCDRLRQAGYDVATFDFPQYGQPSSFFVKQYLNGEYGSAEQVGPYTASLFYALDRYEAAPAIRKALQDGKVVVSNRFTGSSMAHQGTKFKSPEERRGYFIWLDNLEFEMLRIPRPDISFVLRVPADIAFDLIDKKAPREYTSQKRDIHEADHNHLERSVEVYDDLTQLFPKDFQRVDCVRDNKMLEVETIQHMLWEKIVPLLPPPKQLELTNKDIPSAAAAKVDSKKEAILAEPVSEETGADVSKTEAQENAERQPEQTPALQPSKAKSASAMREVTGQHFVVQRASHLLAQRLEGSALAAHLDQSGPTADFTAKSQDGRYRYYTPEDFSSETTQQYQKYMDQIFDLYCKIVADMEQFLLLQLPASKNPSSEAERKQLIRAEALKTASSVLPAAATSDVAVLAFGRTLESLVISLLSDELGEVRAAGEHILKEARAIAPSFLEQGQTSIVYRGGTHTAVGQLAREFLPDNHAAETTPVRLTDVSPRNELDLLPEILYPFSTTPLHELRREIAAWPYNRKLTILEAYIGERSSVQQKPGLALDTIRYGWDLVSDYGSFRDLQRHRLSGEPIWQQLTPRYGYSMPQLIDDAGLSDLYEQCFDLSLELYSLLQQAGHALEAQYATLLGHKMRWKVTYTAGEMFRLQETGPALEAGESYHQLIRAMRDKLTETHPLISDAMQLGQKQQQ